MATNSSGFYKALGYQQGGQVDNNFYEKYVSQGYDPALIRSVMAAGELKKRGYSDEAIAGIMGNIAVESGDTFDPAVRGDQGDAYGVFQMNFMKPYYDEWRGDKEDTIANQVEFMHQTLQGEQQHVIGAGTAKELRELLATDNPDAITEGFMAKWERPDPTKSHLDRRIESGQSYYNQLKGQ